MKTKKEALHELSCYMHDLKIAAKQEGFKVSRSHEWEQMVETWEGAGEIDSKTAQQWVKSGPR